MWCRVGVPGEDATAGPGLPTAMAAAPDIPPTGRSSVVAPDESMDDLELVGLHVYSICMHISKSLASFFAERDTACRLYDLIRCVTTVESFHLPGIAQ